MSKTTNTVSADSGKRPDPPGIPPAAHREAALSESHHDDLDLASFPQDVRWMVRVFGE